MVLPLVFGIGVAALIAAILFLYAGIGLSYEGSGTAGAFGAVFIIIGILAAIFGVGLIFGGV